MQIKFLPASLAKLSLGLDLVFMEFLIRLCLNSRVYYLHKEDIKYTSTGKEHELLGTVS